VQGKQSARDPGQEGSAGGLLYCSSLLCKASKVLVIQDRTGVRVACLIVAFCLAKASEVLEIHRTERGQGLCDLQWLPVAGGQQSECGPCCLHADPTPTDGGDSLATSDMSSCSSSSSSSSSSSRGAGTRSESGQTAHSSDNEDDGASQPTSSGNSPAEGLEDGSEETGYRVRGLLFLSCSGGAAWVC